MNMGHLIILFTVLSSTYALWVFYLAVMCLKRAKDAGTISRLALYLAYPVLAIGLLIDLFVNIFVFSLILLELPEELTVTARLKRHGQRGGWRGDFSRWFCESLLDTFDPSGDHC